MTLTSLPWKQNQLLLSAPLLVAEYQETTWRVNSISTNQHFALGALVCIPLLSSRYHLKILFPEISINLWNVKKAVLIISERIAYLCFGAHLDGMFIFIRHRHTKDVQPFGHPSIHPSILTCKYTQHTRNHFL